MNRRIYAGSAHGRVEIQPGCRVHSPTVINITEDDDGARTAEPWTPGEYGFSGLFLYVGHILTGPKSKRKAIPVARVFELSFKRVVAVPIDAVRADPVVIETQAANLMSTARALRYEP
jgi:hypothetical protein